MYTLSLLFLQHYVLEHAEDLLGVVPAPFYEVRDVHLPANQVHLEQKVAGLFGSEPKRLVGVGQRQSPNEAYVPSPWPATT